MYVQLAQLCVDTVVRLVAFHFTMAYDELTLAMVTKALQNWPIANAEYITKVRAMSVEILLAVPADQTCAPELPLVVGYDGKQVKADYSGFVMDKDEENATAATTTYIVEWKHIGDDHTPNAPEDKIVLDEQQSLGLKAFAKKARAPQCKKVIKDRRVDIGERLCKNKTGGQVECVICMSEPFIDVKGRWNRDKVC